MKPYDARGARAVELSADWYALGGREKVRLALTAAVPTVLAFAALVAVHEHLTPVLLLCVVLAGLVVWRPIVGVYFSFGWIMLFEAGGPDMVMEPGRYFVQGLSSTTDWENVIFSPLELLLLVTTLSWLGRAIGRRSWRRRLDFR